MPTKRIAYYKHFTLNKWYKDAHFNGWLHRIDALPPTKEQLERLYLEDAERKQKAIEWVIT